MAGEIPGLTPDSRPKLDGRDSSRTRLEGFYIHHAAQIAWHLGTIIRRIQIVDPDRFKTHIMKGSKPIQDGHGEIPDVTSKTPILRLSRVRDVLSMDWVILPDGTILTCHADFSSPDVLNTSTLAFPEPRALIEDQSRILEFLFPE
ncbi:MAG: hypothetical protein HYW63_02955 [Candidatus Levybacteria bacterium]|nr:hypothetical protein [Candidatus Levybacteria bacterium]